MKDMYFLVLDRTSQYYYDVSFPKLVYKFNTIPIKTPRSFVNMDELIWKFIGKNYQDTIARKSQATSPTKTLKHEKCGRKQNLNSKQAVKGIISLNLKGMPI